MFDENKDGTISCEELGRLTVFNLFSVILESSNLASAPLYKGDTYWVCILLLFNFIFGSFSKELVNALKRIGKKLQRYCMRNKVHHK